MQATIQSSREWLEAVRPATLTVALSPALAGTAISLHDGFSRPIGALAVGLAIAVAAVTLQAAMSIYLSGSSAPADRWGGLVELLLFVLLGLGGTWATAYLADGQINPLAFCAALAMVAFGVGILTIDHVTGAESGAATSELTMAGRLGPPLALSLGAGLFVAGFEVPVLVFALHLGPAAQLLALLASPLALGAFRIASAGGGEGIWTAVNLAAATELAFALLWSLGLLL